MGYLDFDRKRLVWGHLEEGIKSGLTFGQIIESIRSINTIEQLFLEDWTTLLTKLQTLRDTDDYGRIVPMALREELIFAVWVEIYNLKKE